MRYSINPMTRRMWAASDAHLPGSGQQLEAWALGEIRKAVDAGELDMNNPTALTSYLRSLGITPEKGGGRFLYNKFMGPESPLRAVKSSANMRSALNGVPAGGMGQMPSGVPGGMPSGDPLREAGRNALMNRFGPSLGGNLTLGPLAQPNDMTNDWSNWR